MWQARRQSLYNGGIFFMELQLTANFPDPLPFALPIYAG